QEENRGRNQVGQKSLPFVPIESRRNEHVDLRRHNREREESSAEHCKLQLSDEIFEQPGIDEFSLLAGHASHPHVQPGQNVVDGLSEEEAADKSDGKRDQRLDQPRTQLDQMLHERRLGRLDVLVRHAGLPPASCALGSAGSGAAAGAAAASGPAAAGTRSGGGTAGASAPDNEPGASSAGFSVIARSMWCCVLSNSRRTSPTGSKLA